MEVITGIVNSIVSLLGSLSWPKVFQLAVVLFILGVSFLFYQVRDQIIDYVTQVQVKVPRPNITSISADTIKTILTQISGNDIIEAVSVAIVDLEKNTRSLIYIGSTDKNVLQEFNEYNVLNKELPWFSTNEVQNSLIVRLLNGEFVCSSYAETNLAIEMPDTNKNIKWICYVGMPPYYGKFVGVVSLYLKRQPNSTESDELRVIMKGISTLVYDKEINKK